MDYINILKPNLFITTDLPELILYLLIDLWGCYIDMCVFKYDPSVQLRADPPCYIAKRKHTDTFLTDTLWQWLWMLLCYCVLVWQDFNSLQYVDCLHFCNHPHLPRVHRDTQRSRCVKLASSGWKTEMTKFCLQNKSMKWDWRRKRAKFVCFLPECFHLTLLLLLFHYI